MTPAARRADVLADLVAGSLIRDGLLVAGGAVLVGLLAQATIHLSFTPVPITGQTLAVLLTSSALGWRRGTLATLLYLLAGLAGVPWFAAGASGYLGASFGYVVGFVLCALACGWLAQHGADRRLVHSVPAMLLGEVVMYAAGVSWLAIYLHVGVARALSLGLTPFLVGDLIKASLAATLLPGVWALLRRGH
jgi:biotin transport system substrate-specific component